MSEETPIIDAKKLAAFTKGDENTRREFLSLFINNAKECLIAMEKSCNESNDLLWGHGINELANLANLIGALAIFKQCNIMLELPANENLQTIQSITELKSEIKKLQIIAEK